ncbi:MAG: anion transporter [Anaerolineae bacterium]
MLEHWPTVAIVGLTYAGIAAGRVPGLRMNRTTIAVAGVGLLLVARQMTFGELASLIDSDTLVLLFSMMVLNANLRLAGFYERAGLSLLSATHSPRGLLAVVIVASGLLSALLLNDTICLMFTPLVVSLTSRAGRRPTPYLIALATAANIGSVATITGNPQNMIIGVASGIPYLRFVGALAPVALLGLGVVWVVLVLLYPREYARGRYEIVAPTEANPSRVDRALMVKSLVITGALLIAFLAGVPVALAAFLAACALLITRRVDPEEVLRSCDWGLLVFFCGLFVLSGVLETNGITAALFGALRLDGSTGVWSLTAVTTLLSNLVSNVPAVLLLKPVVAGLANPEAGWLTLAMASTLAGNLTLLGSVANLIVAESAGARGVRLAFWEYTRAGLIITALSLALGGLWLQLVSW